MLPELRRYFPIRALAGLALAVLFYFMSQGNYPLFHSIADMVTVFIAGSVFIVVWNGRRHLDNHYYLFIAIAFLAFALLDFMHLIGNKGMGVFPAYGNLGPTFYIASRYVLGVSFLLAPLFIKRKVSTSPVFAAYLLVVALVLLAVFHWHNFPAAYIEGSGLTAFKVYSDYAVCLMLLGGLGLLLLNRRAFGARVLKIIALSLVFSIATGLAFTLYADPFGITNAVGHFFQITSFYLVYVGFVETVLTKPQNILYRNLKQSNDSILQLNSELENLNLSLSRDIAARKRAEEALRVSERRLVGVLESMPDAFISLDAGMRYMYVNANAERLQAARREELLGKDVRVVYPDAESRKTTRLYEQVLREQKPATQTSYHAGFDRWVEVRAFPTPDGVSVFYKDVSAQVKAREALRAMNESLEQRVAERTAEVRLQAEQLRALAVDLSQTEQRERQRLAKVLHDHIQQLLVAARMQLGLIQRHGLPEQLHAVTRGVDAILQEALDASRSLAVELSPPILHQAGLVSALNWLASRLQEKNQFVVHVRADNKAEPAREDVRLLLFESARELLLNAMKYSGVSEADVALVRSTDGHIKLMVSDAGKGFDADLLRKRSPAETSFGLFSIQQRLAHIGGTMEVVSAPGKGTSISLIVPADEAVPLPSTPQAAAGSAGQIVVRERTPARRILIVDDHKIMREGLAGLMQFEPDIEIVGEASNGGESIELARHCHPDAIIMDIDLGDMSGVEATRQIHAINPNIKIIGLSMHADKNVVAALLSAGAVACLTKGGPSEDLMAALRRHVPAAKGGAVKSQGPISPTTNPPADVHEMPEMEGKMIRVLVADDHDKLRAMIVGQLRHAQGIEVVGEAGDGEEAVRLAHALRPDVVVMDVSMPRMCGVDAMGKLRTELPAVKVVALSAYAETDAQSNAMRSAGAVDCILKESSCEKLIAAIRAAKS